MGHHHANTHDIYHYYYHYHNHIIQYVVFLATVLGDTSASRCTRCHHSHKNELWRLATGSHIQRMNTYAVTAPTNVERQPLLAKENSCRHKKGSKIIIPLMKYTHYL